MLTLIVRAIIVYLLVLVVFRLMGKRQIGEMQPFELVLTLVIADLATIPMLYRSSACDNFCAFGCNNSFIKVNIRAWYISCC